MLHTAPHTHTTRLAGRHKLASDMELQVHVTVLAAIPPLLRAALAHGRVVQHLAHGRGQCLARRHVRLADVFARHHLVAVGTPLAATTARHRSKVLADIHHGPRHLDAATSALQVVLQGTNTTPHHGAARFA